MIVATALFYAFECISLQDRCSYAHPYDVKESFLQLCLATLSLHCNPLPLGRGAATPTQKRRAGSPSRQSKGLHIVRYRMPFKSLNVSRARERRMDRLTDSGLADSGTQGLGSGSWVIPRRGIAASAIRKGGKTPASGYGNRGSTRLFSIFDRSIERVQTSWE